ncbi:MAG: hypothetical protein R3B82_01330 [Sandaracinaceae bacterium]
MLTGIGPLIAWRKATGKNLPQRLRLPWSASATMFLAHLFGGEALGFPPFVPLTELYETVAGVALGKLYVITLLFSTTPALFVLATVLQEFYRGVAVRMARGEPCSRSSSSCSRAAAGRRVHRPRRHRDDVWGFTGAPNDQETESSLRPGQTLSSPTSSTATTTSGWRPTPTSAPSTRT